MNEQQMQIMNEFNKKMNELNVAYAAALDEYMTRNGINLSKRPHIPFVWGRTQEGRDYIRYHDKEVSKLMQERDDKLVS